MNNPTVVIIGGGISGIAVARQLSEQGIDVTLLEKSACCKATSDNSLRIVHGGFRYLQTLDLRRLISSLSDQTAALAEYSDLILPLPCFMALSGRKLKSRWPVEVASRVYSGFMSAQRSLLPRPEFVAAKEVGQRVPCLQNRAGHGALQWHDALLVRPAELGIRIAQAATAAGAKILEQQCVTWVREDSAGALMVETESGGTFRAGVVINTAGPWIRDISLAFQPKMPNVMWCKGFNIIVRRQLDPTNAVGFESAEGRLFFVVPREADSAIGTWYVPVSDVSNPPSVSEEEIDLFLAEFNKACPQHVCSKHDVVATDVGYLPMKALGKDGPELFGSEIVTTAGGYIEVVSTKYTTFRSQAASVSKIAQSRLRGAAK